MLLHMLTIFQQVSISYVLLDLHISKPLALALIFSSINLLCGPLKHSAMCTIASNLKCRQVSAEKDLKKQPEMHFGCVIQMDYTSPGAGCIIHKKKQRIIYKQQCRLPRKVNTLLESTDTIGTELLESGDVFLWIKF